MVAVHQVLPVFAPRDAIGNHAVAVRAALQAMGIRSDIYAGTVSAGAGRGAQNIRDYRSARRGPIEPTWLLYHASTGSEVADWFAERPEAKLVDYHNMSPPELLGPWEPYIGAELEHGRRQLAELADITEWAIADSSYNEREVAGLGYRRTRVVPILIETIARRASTGVPHGSDWLFVSRLLPHKAQHDVVKAFAVYRRTYDPKAQLWLVGAVGSGRYADALADYVEDLGLAGAVHLTGSIGDAELEDLYRRCGIYVCLSDHEGFGVPILEAMAHELPVIAYAAAAVPETAGDAAVLLDDKRPTVVAAAADRVMRDSTLRHQMVTAGHRRVEVFSLAASTKRLQEVIGMILADAGVCDAGVSDAGVSTGVGP